MSDVVTNLGEFNKTLVTANENNNVEMFEQVPPLEAEYTLITTYSVTPYFVVIEQNREK